MDEMTPERIQFVQQLRAMANETQQQAIAMRAEIEILEFSAGKAVSMSDVRKSLDTHFR